MRFNNRQPIVCYMKGLSSNQSRRRHHGFTLIELMLTIVMAAAIASIAVPNLRTFVLNNRISGTANELLRSIQVARSHATKRQNNVVICATDKAVSDPDNATCATTGVTGWIIFLDFNSNWDRDLPGEELIEVHTFENTNVHLLANNSKKVSFAASGFANPTGSTPATQTASTDIVICDSRGNAASGSSGQSVARGLKIEPTGRVRMSRSVSDITSWLSTIGAACS